MRRIFPIVMGIAGVAVLCGLGIWQVQRLAWKTGVLAEIDATIVAAPTELPPSPDPVADRWRPVRIVADLTGEEVHVLTSSAGEGPGYRIIAKAQTETGRAVMVDLGFVPQADKDAARAAGGLTVTGNLLWPDEADSWTPEPDPANIWFARDVPRMAAALGTEPVLIVARQIDGAAPHTMLLPVDTSTVPNDHLGYAVTWFSLAAVWAVMSAALVIRNRKAN